jgi:hypothetical protein
MMHHMMARTTEHEIRICPDTASANHNHPGPNITSEMQQHFGRIAIA